MSPDNSVINIFVGNLDFGVTEDELRAAFCVFGSVQTVTIVLDRDTGRTRGFAFVEMVNSEQAENAIHSLNGTLVNGRPIRVNEARPKSPHSDAFDGRDHRRHRI